MFSYVFCESGTHLEFQLSATLFGPKLRDLRYAITADWSPVPVTSGSKRLLMLLNYRVQWPVLVLVCCKWYDNRGLQTHHHVFGKTVLYQRYQYCGYAKSTKHYLRQLNLLLDATQTNTLVVQLGAKPARCSSSWQFSMSGGLKFKVRLVGRRIWFSYMQWWEKQVLIFFPLLNQQLQWPGTIREWCARMDL